MLAAVHRDHATCSDAGANLAACCYLVHGQAEHRASADAVPAWGVSGCSEDNLLERMPVPCDRSTWTPIPRPSVTGARSWASPPRFR